MSGLARSGHGYGDVGRVRESERKLTQLSQPRQRSQLPLLLPLLANSEPNSACICQSVYVLSTNRNRRGAGCHCGYCCSAKAKAEEVPVGHNCSETARWLRPNAHMESLAITSRIFAYSPEPVPVPVHVHVCVRVCVTAFLLRDYITKCAVDSAYLGHRQPIVRIANCAHDQISTLYDVSSYLCDIYLQA